MIIKCKRTRCWGNKDTFDEEHKAYLKRGNDRWWVYLDPGVTGYESIDTESLIKCRDRKGHWPACVGTDEKWDRLVVPNEEINRLVDIVELLPI